MVIPFIALVVILVIVALVFIYGMKKKQSGEDLGEHK